MIILLFFIAVVYVSAGFAGGSMYLAVLSNAFPESAWIRVPAILCNMTASGVGSMRFLWSRLVPLRNAGLLLCVSVPMTMWAASWSIQKEIFLGVLGLALIIAGVSLLIKKTSYMHAEQTTTNPWWIYPVVACIGIVSGVTGIGGGIYLAPILHTTNWAPPKKIAATTSLFIFVNSMFSFVILILKGISWQPQFASWMIAVGIGALVGGQLSVAYLKGPQLKIITGLLLIIVGCKILIEI